MSAGIAQLFLNLGTRRGCVVSITPRPPLPPGKDPVPIEQEAGWAPEPVWIGAQNLAPLGFDPQTFQPVASHYTDYAIPAPVTIVVSSNSSFSKSEAQIFTSENLRLPKIGKPKQLLKFLLFHFSCTSTCCFIHFAKSELLTLHLESDRTYV